MPSKAIAEVVSLPAAKQIRGGNITDRLRAARRVSFVRVRGRQVDVSGNASAFLSDLTETFATVYLENVPPGSVITYIHGVTGPSAIRLLLPHLDAAARSALLRYGWQGAAALYAASGGNVGEPAPRRRRRRATATISWTAPSRPATSTRSSSPRRVCVSTR